jgi:hypothetical protein
MLSTLGRAEGKGRLRAMTPYEAPLIVIDELDVLFGKKWEWS